MKYIVLLLLSLIFLALCEQEFSADFTISGGSLQGVLTGKLYYSTSRQGIRYSYTGGYDEITLYDTKDGDAFFQFRKCPSKCDVVPIDPNTIFPKFYYENGDSCASSTISTKYGDCFVCTKSSGPVKSVCVADKTNYLTTRVTLDTGKVIEVDPSSKGSVTDSNLDANPWGCQLNCGSQLDIVMIIDESDSISGNYIPGYIDSGEWKLQRKFASEFIKNFEIADDKVHMGLVQFARGSRKVIGYPHIISDEAQFTKVISKLTKNVCGYPDPTKWNTVRAAQICRSATWTGFGIIDAVNILKDKSGARKLRELVGKVAVVVTDGRDNHEDVFKKDGKNWKNPEDYIQYTVDNNVKVIAVGVGNGINFNFIQKLSSTGPTGEKLAFKADNFDQLASSELIKALGKSVCTATGNPSLDCPVCNGICVCGKCECPSSCDIADKCKQGTCSASKNNAGGCVFEPKICDDNNKCTTDTCDSSVGCQYTNVSCDDGDGCTVDECKPTTGCRHIKLNCDTGDICMTSQCDSSTTTCTTPVTTGICENQGPCNPTGANPIQCNNNDECYVERCLETSGKCEIIKELVQDCIDANPGDECNKIGCQNGNCTFEPHPDSKFDDGNMCTDDYCVNSGSDKGIKHDPIDVDVRCNDYNVCTNDYCDIDTGCVNEPINCTGKYNDSCIEEFCDKLKGCEARPKKCNLTAGKDPDCFIAYCSEGKCVEEELEGCKYAGIIAAGAAGLGVAAIIGIIAAAVVGAGAAAGGVYAGYSFFTSADFTNKSAIYEPETQVCKNELYNS